MLRQMQRRFSALADLHVEQEYNMNKKIDELEFRIERELSGEYGHQDQEPQEVYIPNVVIVQGGQQSDFDVI